MDVIKRHTLDRMNVLQEINNLEKFPETRQTQQTPLSQQSNMVLQQQPNISSPQVSLADVCMPVQGLTAAELAVSSSASTISTSHIVQLGIHSPNVAQNNLTQMQLNSLPVTSNSSLANNTIPSARTLTDRSAHNGMQYVSVPYTTHNPITEIQVPSQVTQNVIGSSSHMVSHLTSVPNITPLNHLQSHGMVGLHPITTTLHGVSMHNGGTTIQLPPGTTLQAQNTHQLISTSHLLPHTSQHSLDNNNYF